MIADGSTGDRWQSWIDKAIDEAHERGEFENLPGHGKPLDVGSNPLAGDSELALHVLKNAGMAPYWMELGKEIHADRAAMDNLRERTAAYLSEQRARVRAARLQQNAEAEAASRPSEGPASRGWMPFRRRRINPPPAASIRPPSLVDLETDRRRARHQYLERAEQLNTKIGAYNDALPSDLKWLERPRLAPDRAAYEFDVTCSPVTDEP